MLPRNSTFNRYTLKRIFNKFFLIFTYCFLVGLEGLFSLEAQAPYFINFTTNDGLPSVEVYDIREDSNGKLWFTTDRGVAVYDGYSFKTYSTSDKMTSNTNFNFIELKNDDFFLTAYNGGLCHYEEGAFKEHKHNSALIDRTKNVWIRSWLLYDNHLLFLPNKEREQFFTFNLSSGLINSFPALTQQNFYSSTSKGDIYQTKFKDREVFFIKNLLAQDIGSTVSIEKQRIEVNENEYIIEFKNSALVWKNNQFNSIPSLESVSVECMRGEENGDLWLGTNKGLFYYQGGDITVKPEVFFENLTISAIHKDKDDNYWIASIQKGIFFVPSFKIKALQNLPTEILSEKIGGFGLGLKDSNLIFVTSQWKGFHIKDSFARDPLNRNKNFEIYPLVCPTYSYNVFTNSSILILSRFNKFRIETAPFTANHPKKRTIGPKFILNEKSYISPNYTGFSTRFFNGDPQFYSDLHSTSNTKFEKRITSLLKDSQDNIWIGSMDGLYRFNTADYKYIYNHNKESKLLQTRISSLLEIEKNNLWISTIGNGLLLYTQDSVYQISTQEGLSSNLINCIELENDSTLWVGTNNGLNKVNFQLTGKNIQLNSIEIYTKQDGLFSNFINDIIFWNGNLWLALDKGINYLSPKDLIRNIKPPKIFIASVEVQNLDSLLEENGQLAYNENDVKINFKGVCYNKPFNRTFYRYKLLRNGKENDWFHTNDVSAQFLDLPSGSYRFIVDARNKNGEWSISPASFNFEIAAHFSSTFWFRTLVLLGIIGMLGLFFWFRYSALIREKALQGALFRSKNAELSALRNQMNPHFVFNSLNSIQNFIFNKDVEQANYYLSNFSKLMRDSLELSKLDFITMEKEIAFIQNYLELEQMRFPEKFDFEISVDNSLNQEYIFIPPLIIQPILENSIKHGFKHIDYKGKIYISFQKTNEKKLIKIRVEDNGKGIAKDNKKLNSTGFTSHGMGIIKERINLFNSNNPENKSSFVFGNKKDKNGFYTDLFIPLKND